MSEIHAAYIGWRTYLNGPLVQSSSSVHQWRSVENAQKWNPKPRITRIIPIAFVIPLLFVNIGRKVLECSHVNSDSNTILITAPLGPTPKIFWSLLVTMNYYVSVYKKPAGKTFWRVNFHDLATVLNPLSIKMYWSAGKPIRLRLHLVKCVFSASPSILDTLRSSSV